MTLSPQKIYFLPKQKSSWKVLKHITGIDGGTNGAKKVVHVVIVRHEVVAGEVGKMGGDRSGG